MKREQKNLVVAIATLLGSGLATPSAFSAAIDLTKATIDPATYAQEIAGNYTLSLGDIRTYLGPNFNAAKDKALPAGATYYATFKFNNAEIIYSPSATTLAVGGGASGAIYFAGADATIPGTATALNGVMTNGSFMIGSNSTYGCGTDTTGAAYGGGTATVNFSSIRRTADASPSPSNGNNYVVFELVEKSLATASTFLSAGCTVTANIPQIKVIDPNKPVTLTYALHTNIFFANNDSIGEAAFKKDKVMIVGVAEALKFTPDGSATDATAGVTTNFVKFKDAANTPTGTDKNSAGAFTLALNPYKDALNASVTMSTYLGGSGGTLTTATILVEGDFSSIYGSGTNHSVFLNAKQDCSGTGIQTMVGTKGQTSSSVLVPTSYSFPIGGRLADWADATGFNYKAYLCFQLGEKATGGSTSTTFQIAETTQFKATLVPAVGNTLYNVPAGRSVTLKAIKRDGMSLEAPYLGLPTGYNNRIMLSHLNKTGLDAKFYITLRSDLTEYKAGGTVPTTPYYTQKKFSGTLKAGSLLHIPVSEIVEFPAGQGKTRVAAVITFESPNEDIQGVFQSINLTTNEIVSLPMTRPGGCDGGAKGGCGK